MKVLFVSLLFLTLFLLSNSISLSQICTIDVDCDDGLFCNGQEICDPADSGADAMGCVDGPDPCTLPGTVCNDDTDVCDLVCGAGFDDDGDGVDDIACGGSDCDDNDANRFPGNAEVCDLDDHDEDCDPDTPGFRDMDGDGFNDENCCNVGADGTLNCGNDCDDFSRYINPNQNDICNGIDEDCDGIDDDGDYRSTLYPDNDQDGYGVLADTPTGAINGCSVPMGNLGIGDTVGGLGYSFNSGDCDDSNPAIKPGAMVCSQEGTDIVLVCNNQGVFEASQCVEDSQCIPQPNGTGFCQAKKVKKAK